MRNIIRLCGQRPWSAVHHVSTVVFLCVAAAMLNVSSAIPPMTTMQVVPILHKEETRHPSGEFSLRYVTGDGIVLAEVGKLKSTDDGKDMFLVKEGSYSYTSPEGQLVQLSYVADERGFRPVTQNRDIKPPEEKQ